MDNPASDPDLLRRTVAQFRFINRVLSRTRRLLKRWVLRDARNRRLDALKVLDLGSGDGEIARWLYRRISAEGLAPEVTALDHDPRIYHLARDAGDGAPVRLRLGRAPEELPDEPFEYVVGNHFLHHLSDNELSILFAALKTVCTRRCVFNDLYRGAAAYAAYTVFAGLFLWRSFAFYDGRLSIRRGFRPGELIALARDAGWEKVRAFRRLPGHAVLVLEQ